VIKHFSFKSPPYPSLDKQRAALVNKPAVPPTRILDSAAIINDLEYLASDTCEGRKPGSAGHASAVERIAYRMRVAGLDSFNNSLIDTFTAGKSWNKITTGKNIIGWIKGASYPEKYIVISAHYDHLGKIGPNIYYGASDNASGTACILAMAKYFRQHPLPCSLIFAAFDREESGIEGSFNFVDQLPPPLNLSNIRLNLNVDMIARNDNNEIFICGIHHSPSLIYAVKETQNKTNAKLLMGHDKGNVYENWTSQSDHFSFYKKSIPFLYIGVEDHVDYHKPTDTYDKINYSSYIENCNMVVLLVKTIKL
jgi:Zn-dependent M28 family amino/carboxypeptidase